MSIPQDVIGLDFRALAEFDYRICRLGKASPNVTGAIVLDSLQQLLLNVRGLPSDLKPTVSILAHRLQIRHHSAVELIDRSVERGLVERRRDKVDRRQVTVHLTPKGNRLANKLAQWNFNELHMGGRDLLRVLHSLLCQPPGIRRQKSHLSRGL